MLSLAIIPARGGSKGLPGKNIRELGGKPLIAYSIEAALQAGNIDRVIVSTDDEKIAEVALKFGAEVPFLRPDYLSTDTAGTIDVVLHALEYFEAGGISFDNVILLQPTSPLRSSKDIKKALALFDNNKCDSVISVCEAMVHPLLLRRIGQNGLLQDFIEQRDKHVRRQDMEKVYQLNGAIYITKVGSLERNHSFYGERNIPYVMSEESSMDIDEELDLQVAELILKKNIN